MRIVESGPGYYGCLSFPHGVLSLVPLLVSPAALALSLASLLVCEFLWVSERTIFYRAATYDDFGNITAIDRDIVWRVGESYGLRRECYNGVQYYQFDFPDDYYLGDDSEIRNPFNPWSDPDTDENAFNKFRSAEASICMAILIGAFVVQFSYFMICIGYSRLVLLLFSIGYFLCFFFTSMSMLAFSSDLCESTCVNPLWNDTRNVELFDVPPNDACHDGCTVGAGAGMGIAAILLWLICFFVNSYMIIFNAIEVPQEEGKTPEIEMTPEQPQQEEYHGEYQAEEYHQDGGNIEVGPGQHEVTPLMPPPVQARPDAEIDSKQQMSI